MNATISHPPVAVTHPRILRALVIFVALCALVLVSALFTGATTLFTVAVSTLFVVLWFAFAAAVFAIPETLDDVWRSLRQRSLLTQAVLWLLLLPIIAGLFIWERNWHRIVRLSLVVAIAAFNLYLFLGRG